MALDPNRWTLKTQEAFNGGVEAARSRNNPEVTPEHVLLAMLGQEDTVTLPVLGKVGLRHPLYGLWPLPPTITAVTIAVATGRETKP